MALFQAKTCSWLFW